ncbi:hypothetical protein MRX96_002842 [Rhipicephalus microplus]
MACRHRSPRYIVLITLLISVPSRRQELRNRGAECIHFLARTQAAEAAARGTCNCGGAPGCTTLFEIKETRGKRRDSSPPLVAGLDPPRQTAALAAMGCECVCVRVCDAIAAESRLRCAERRRQRLLLLPQRRSPVKSEGQSVHTQGRAADDRV